MRVYCICFSPTKNNREGFQRILLEEKHFMRQLGSTVKLDTITCFLQTDWLTDWSCLQKSTVKDFHCYMLPHPNSCLLAYYTRYNACIMGADLWLLCLICFPENTQCWFMVKHYWLAITFIICGLIIEKLLYLKCLIISFSSSPILLFTND